MFEKMKYKLHDYGTKRSWTDTFERMKEYDTKVKEYMKENKNQIKGCIYFAALTGFNAAAVIYSHGTSGWNIAGMICGGGGLGLQGYQIHRNSKKKKTEIKICLPYGNYI